MLMTWKNAYFQMRKVRKWHTMSILFLNCVTYTFFRVKGSTLFFYTFHFIFKEWSSLTFVIKKKTFLFWKNKQAQPSAANLMIFSVAFSTQKATLLSPWMPVFLLLLQVLDSLQVNTCQSERMAACLLEHETTR